MEAELVPDSTDNSPQDFERSVSERSESGRPESSRPESNRKAKLFDFLKGAPHIVPLSEDEDAEILKFFDQTGMSGGGFRLLMQRKPKFFDLFKHRGGISRAVGLRDDNGRLVGTGAITTTPCFIDSKPGNFVYLADLRVQTRDAALVREWRDWFGKVMKEAGHIEEAGENGRMVCAIIETNARARRVLEERVHRVWRETSQPRAIREPRFISISASGLAQFLWITRFIHISASERFALVM